MLGRRSRQVRRLVASGNRKRLELVEERINTQVLCMCVYDIFIFKKCVYIYIRYTIYDIRYMIYKI